VSIRKRLFPDVILRSNATKNLMAKVGKWGFFASLRMTVISLRLDNNQIIADFKIIHIDHIGLADLQSVISNLQSAICNLKS
jgi:hypothetical protein